MYAGPTHRGEASNLEIERQGRHDIAVEVPAQWTVGVRQHEANWALVVGQSPHQGGFHLATSMMKCSVALSAPRLPKNSCKVPIYGFKALLLDTYGL